MINKDEMAVFQKIDDRKYLNLENNSRRMYLELENRKRKLFLTVKWKYLK